MTSARNLDTASIFLFVGFLSWPFGAGKVIPGGPYISVFGDIIPATSAIVTIVCAIPFINFPMLRIKASAIGHMTLAIILLTLVCLGVVGFYFDAHARGDAIGW